MLSLRPVTCSFPSATNYIVIGALASGDPVLCEKSGEKISIYDHETGSVDDELIYDDFYAFLNDFYDLLGIGE